MNNSIVSNSTIINNSVTSNSVTSTSLNSTSLNSTSIMNNSVNITSVTSTSLTNNYYLEMPILTRQNGCSDLFKLLNNDEADKNISRQYSTDSNDSNNSHSSNNSDYDKSNFDNFEVSSLFILPPSTDENYLYFNADQNNGTVLRSPAECNKFTNDELNYMNEMQIDQYSAFLN